MAFNKLSPAAAERLALLLEEMGEAIQAIGKIQRHGYENYHPDSPEISNLDDLNRELGHVLAAIDFLIFAKDIDDTDLANSQEAKHESVKKWMYYN